MKNTETEDAFVSCLEPSELNTLSDEGGTQLMIAADQGRINVINRLLTAGVPAVFLYVVSCPL